MYRLVALVLLSAPLASARAVADSAAQVVDAPSEHAEPPPPRGFNPTPVPEVLIPAVRVHFWSPTRNVSFFILADSLRSRGIGPGGGVGIGVDRAGATFRPGFGVYSSKTVARAYELICDAPCEASVAIGDYALGLSLDDGAPVVAKPMASLTRRSMVQGRYIDRSKMRKAGWWVFGGGFIAGVVIMLTGLDYDTDNNQIDSVQSGALFGTGMALMGASIIVGVPMLTRKDRATITVRPLE